jgi:ATP-dependent DNA helicase
MLKTQMDAAKAPRSNPASVARKSKAPAKSRRTTRKRALVESEDEGEEPSKRVKLEDKPDSDASVFSQPVLITGTTLKPYQLEGVEWMIGLHQNGISGILGMSSVWPSITLESQFMTKRTRWVSGR